MTNLKVELSGPEDKPLLTSISYEGPSYYQYLSNGGISYSVERKDLTTNNGSTRRTMRLNIRLSNMGVATHFSVPVYATTADVFEALAKEIRAAGDIEPSYLTMDTAKVQGPNHEVVFKAPSKNED